MIFEDVYTFDEDKKGREIEERTDEILKLIEHAKQKLSEIDADARVRPAIACSGSCRAAQSACDRRRLLLRIRMGKRIIQ